MDINFIIGFVAIALNSAIFFCIGRFMRIYKLENEIRNK